MKYDISIIFPCLNEEKTIEECIVKTKKVMDKTKYKYEIIVSDNGSTDNSVKIAKKLKARVVSTDIKGYGSALINGINHARGKYSVMLDSDCSYNIEDIPSFIKEINKGYDMVVGNRFNDKSEKNACPFVHRLGAKVLSLYANILFHAKVKDYHCGLRIFDTKKVKELELSSTGMEFASEMILKAKTNKFKISNINTKYMKDKRDNKSHLHPLRDGLRHLNLINKIKFDNSIIFRYLSVIIITSILCFFLLCISSLFKINTHDNVKDAYHYYKENDLYYFIDEKLNNSSYRLDYITDQRMLSIAYLMDKQDSITSTIEMNYYVNLQTRGDLDNYVDNENQLIVDYSRYWHGYILLLKPLISIFNIQTIYVINIILFIILLITVLIKLFQHDKLLCIAFIVGLIGVNAFIVPMCLEYVYIFYLMFALILILLRMYDNKSKNIDLLFLISGLLTCYFDFLTCETITLTVPLMIYGYLNIKNGKHINYKEYIKYIVLWGIGYTFMFGIKWIIDIIHYGSNMASDIYKRGMFRVNSEKEGLINIMLANLTNVFIYLFPFNYIQDYALTIILIIIAINLYNFIFYEDNKKDKLMLILISLIPIVRYIVLVSHTKIHIYFVYRAMIPVVMLLTIGVYRLIKNKK